jgi:hypothetical protein
VYVHVSQVVFPSGSRTKISKAIIDYEKRSTRPDHLILLVSIARIIQDKILSSKLNVDDNHRPILVFAALEKK